MVSRQGISAWFDAGRREGYSHLIVACDTYNYEDYPVYCMTGEEARKRFSELNGPNMQSVHEVYDLSESKDEQMQEHRALHLPKE